MPFEAPEESKRVSCPACGEENLAFASFCILCGEPLDESGEPGSLLTASSLPESTAEPFLPTEHPAPANTRKILRLERALGIMLVVVALGFALYNWRISVARSDAYREGISAAQSRDWDRAAGSFSEAGDYLDSIRRKSEARRNIEERDRLYTAGVQAQQTGEWISAISAFEKLLSLQPAYRDAEKRLEESRNSAILYGLADVAYLVADGPTPGLYVRDAQGNPSLLPDSDGQSAIRAVSPDGRFFVYDRPHLESDPFQPWSAYAQLGVRVLGMSGPSRVVVLARREEGKPLSTLALPRLSPGGTGVFSENGLWWYTPAPDFISGYELFYVERSDPNDVTQVSNYLADRRVVALDPPRSRVIIAETVRQTREGSWKSRIYLAGAAGDNPQILQEVEGRVQAASVSSDGSWLLFQTERGAANVARSVWVMPIDTPWATLNANKLDLPAATLLETITATVRYANPTVTAKILPSGDQGPQVLVSTYDGATERLTVYELDTGTHVHIWNEDVEVRPGRSGDLSALSHDGKYMAARHRQGEGSILGLSGIQPGYRTWSSVPLPAGKQQAVKVRFAPGNEAGKYSHVVASISETGEALSDTAQAIYSSPVLHNGTLSGIRRIATASLPYEGELPATALPANGSIFAYVSTQHELRAVFLDGTQDTVVAGNVYAVWDLKMPKDIVWQR